MRSAIFLIAAICLLSFLSSPVDSQVTKTFKVTNKTGAVVTSLRISSNDQYNWSLPLNTAERINDNQSFSFNLKIDTARCVYDFKFTTDDSSEYILEDIGLCGKPEFDLAMPEKKD